MNIATTRKAAQEECYLLGTPFPVGLYNGGFYCKRMRNARVRIFQATPTYMLTTPIFHQRMARFRFFVVSESCYLTSILSKWLERYSEPVFL